MMLGDVLDITGKTGMASLTQALWQQAETPRELPKALLAKANNSPLLAGLLWQRGITTGEAAETFLNLADYTPVSGLALPDAEKAITRIKQAIDGGEAIMIYGDFDVDGQTGTSIFMLALEALGANVSFYIPDRASEGHGMNTAALCRLVSSRKPKLVITTDTGITDFNEVSLLAGLGVDCIITDHHELPENLPQSIANVNPKLYDDADHPLYNLCGAGVAFKICEILLKDYGQNLENPQALIDHLHGIAAIGTVVDMMPLVDENRWLVWRGCQFLSEHNHVGVQALLEAAARPTDKPITSETLGFSIGPRLNALGRLERADDGVHLLTTNDAEQAAKIANRLESLNRKRQEMGEQCLLEAEKAMAAKGGLQGDKAIALCSPDWHPGIVGLTATRLKDRFNVPVFLMIEEGDTVRGSARSIPGVDLHAILNHFADEFDHFGGHAGAGGFALPAKNYPAFKQKLLEYCANTIPDELCQPQLAIDAEVGWEQLHTGLVDMVASLAPFGMANPAPQFVTQPLTIVAMRRMGERKQHLKLLLAPAKDTANPVDGLMWNVDGDVPFERGDSVRSVFTPEVNEFKGKVTFQMMLKDVADASGAKLKSQQGDASQSLSVAAKPASPVEALSAPVAAQPAISAAANSAGPASSSSLLWLDHRQREQLTPLLTQLVNPATNQQGAGYQGKSVLFHEGLELPDVPFLTPQQVVTRQQLADAPERYQRCNFVLWDLPPSPQVLASLLHLAQPATIHLVGVAQQGDGGLHQPLPECLRGWFKQLRQLAMGSPQHSLQAVASKLGVTVAFVQALGVLFAQAGLIRWAGGGDQQLVTIELVDSPPRVAIESQPAYPLVSTLWADIVGFRQYLLTAPLQTVEAHVGVMMTVYPAQSAGKRQDSNGATGLHNQLDSADNTRSQPVLAVS